MPTARRRHLRREAERERERRGPGPPRRETPEAPHVRRDRKRAERLRPRRRRTL